jgi:glutaminyl-tRNA synthetase
MAEKSSTPAPNFVRHIINEDIRNGKHGGRVVVRFPPEPNGYLHIGHSKSICFNFGLAEDYNGQCYLRFDDTNPLKESDEYMTAIKEDIRWLGFDWEDRLTHASDYFDVLYDHAKQLIKDGKAYVCSLNAEQIREYRGTLTEPGRHSPDRDRSVEENLDLFERMKNGEFDNGQYTLRAKIDMNSGNINMRDPAMYRILKAKHHRTGDKWCIYPMYDYTHPISDAIEGVTHSLCTLEFQDHRPLYDWFVENCRMEHKPQQIEFSRLNVNYTITSKRKLRTLVEQGYTASWDDPRMPTILGLRRRGFTPAAIRSFNERIGVSKKETVIDMGVLEEEVRQDLNENAQRAMVVMDPIKVTIESYPDGESEEIEVPNHPQKPERGTRKIVFAREIYIDRADFLENPPKKFFRLSPGKYVRLRYGYVITCQDVVKDSDGNVVELKCVHHPETLGGKKPADGRKVKGIIHWVAADHAIDLEVRLYDRLFAVENPAAEEDFTKFLNPESLIVKKGCKGEAFLKDVVPETAFQFERLGYFTADRHDHQATDPIFNRTATLRDTWAKVQKQNS